MQKRVWLRLKFRREGSVAKFNFTILSKGSCFDVCVSCIIVEVRVIANEAHSITKSAEVCQRILISSALALSSQVGSMASAAGRLRIYEDITLSQLCIRNFYLSCIVCN